MTPQDRRERGRRLKIRLAALKGHRAARDPITGKSELAVSAGRASGRQRVEDSTWGLENAIKRWYGASELRKGRVESLGVVDDD